MKKNVGTKNILFLEGIRLWKI